MREKIYCTDDRQVYEIEVTHQGENKQPCPKCSHDRKPENRKKKVFSWNATKEVGQCVHCDSKFVKWKQYNKEKEEKKYVLPAAKETVEGISEKAVEFFEGRGISMTVVKDMGIWTDKEWMPQFSKEVPVVCFPYLVDGIEKNRKYRGPQKSFKLVSGAELVPYNIDVVNFEIDEVCIVEGEMDVLAMMTAGYKNVISPPNGAGNSTAWLDRYIDRFNHLERIILGVDNDEAGRKLRDELSRRFGMERCFVVDWEEEKDANEVLMKHGPTDVVKRINQAKPIPYEGVYTVSDFKDKLWDLFVNGLEKGDGIDHAGLDELVTWETGRLMIVTGVPTHGKSEWVDWLLCKLNIVHGWKSGYYSPENWPIWQHVAKLHSKFSGRLYSRDEISDAWYHQIMDHLEENFFFVGPEDDNTADGIINRVKYLVRTRGIKAFVIDPYNSVETNQGEQSETLFIGKFLDRLRVVARKFDILFILIAHPTKLPLDPETRKPVMPNMYSISGSANFYNKADYGVVVYRNSDENGYLNTSTISIEKVKFKHLGKVGKVVMTYENKSGRYDDDGYNWLDPRPVQSEIIIKREGTTFQFDPDDHIPF